MVVPTPGWTIPTDKVAVVTGGAGGIGSAMAARFLSAGMRVVVADVEPDAIAAAVDALGARRPRPGRHPRRPLARRHRSACATRPSTGSAACTWCA